MGDELKMNKLIIVGVFLLSVISSYFIASVFFLNKPQAKINLDGNYNRVLEEVGNYGGAMIVKYDLKTGKIISKRSANIPQESGVLTLTKDEYKLIGKNVPSNALIVANDVSPSRAIEYIGGKK